MKLYLHFNVKNPKDLLLYQDLLKALKDIGIAILTNLETKKDELDEAGFKSLDALVIDGSAQDAETGYLLAMALANKKPVLYLLRKGNLLDTSIEALTKNAEMKRYLKVAFFASDSLVRKVKGWLQYLDTSVGREIFNLKFTLRLSQRLDRYLTWKADKARKNKADFLRDYLVSFMDSDEDYKNRLQ